MIERGAVYEGKIRKTLFELVWRSASTTFRSSGEERDILSPVLGFLFFFFLIPLSPFFKWGFRAARKSLMRQA